MSFCKGSMDPGEPKKIKALIVEDSPTVAEFLTHLLNSDPNVRVIGVVPDGEGAMEAVARTRPDVITMDIHMPRMNGFDATRQIMETQPTPIVIVSGSSTVEEQATPFRALEAGALTVVARPKGIGHPEFETTSRDFVRTVKLMSEVKVVRRWARARTEKAAPTMIAEPEVRPGGAQIKLIAIGASTGGPLALQTILAGLPKNLPVPVLIVQHMTPGFLDGFVEWLHQSTGFPMHIAGPNEIPRPGHAYVAPDGVHLGVDPEGRIVLSQSDPENGLRPSVSHLFRTVAENLGKNAIGVLLTGMGRDGAAELKLMQDQGAVTIAQDEASSVVHGMPGEAIQLGAAAYVLPPEGIAAALARLAVTIQSNRE